MFGCIWENIVKNIFWCLVVLLKIAWKIHFLLLAHIFLDFLHYQTNIIISFLNLETQITPRKKKFIIRWQLGSTTGEISEADWCCDHDWVRRQATRGRSVFRKGDVRTISFLERQRDWGRQSGSRTIQRRGRGRRFGSRTIGFGVRCSRGRWSESGSSGFFLSLSLSARGHVSLSLSSLCVFFRKWEFKGKIETEINLHPFKGQLKSIFPENAFFVRNQTPVNTEKHFWKCFSPKTNTA